jgi:hypothetical protein
MTEAEWLACTDPQLMLEFLRGKVSDRKLRLFGCACCRGIWHLLTDKRSRRAIDVAERFGDGEVSTKGLAKAFLKAHDAFQEANDDDWCLYHGTNIVSGLVRPVVANEQHPDAYDPIRLSQDVIDLLACEASHAEEEDADGRGYTEGEDLECKRQSGIIRDVLGNPFNPAALDPSWLTSTVLALAAGIYCEKAFDRMPILADALEDAGCDDEDVLNHCRLPGEHVRGCWVLDLVLGKK